jgi:hypothetical protein
LASRSCARVRRTWQVQLSVFGLLAQTAEAQAKVQSAGSQLAAAEAKLAADENTYENLKAASATPGVVAGNDLTLAEKAAQADRAQVKAIQEEDVLRAVPLVGDFLNEIFALIQSKANWPFVCLAACVTLNMQPHLIILAHNIQGFDEDSTVHLTLLPTAVPLLVTPSRSKLVTGHELFLKLRSCGSLNRWRGTRGSLLSSSFEPPRNSLVTIW